MLPVRDFLLVVLFYTGTYSAPQNNQNFNGLKVGGSFYNHVKSPQNDQTFDDWTGDEFFNVRDETGVNPTLRYNQTFRNTHIGGKFYNDVPTTGNNQDFTGLIAEGGFIDANSNGPAQNNQNVDNVNVAGDFDNVVGREAVRDSPNVTDQDQHLEDFTVAGDFHNEVSDCGWWKRTFIGC